MERVAAEMKMAAANVVEELMPVLDNLGREDITTGCRPLGHQKARLICCLTKNGNDPLLHNVHTCCKSAAA